MEIERYRKQSFGEIREAETVFLHTLINQSGLQISLMDLGASLVRIITPDRDGQLDDITLGFDQASEYLEKAYFIGSVAGRYANRIAGGSFNLDGVNYQLETNNGVNHLHGGSNGFDKQVWRASHRVEADRSSVEFNYLSPDGEAGYPGNLEVSV